MASNSILKLQVDDQQYEASLRSAQQGLQALMNALRNSGKSFSDLDKNTAQYVRALGNMDATAKTTRGRIGEMSSAFVELSQVEKQLTDQERQSPVGKALTESLNQLKQRTIEAKQELADLDKQLSSQKAPETIGGGLFSGLGDKMGGALQVFAGNMLTKAAGAVANLGSEMVDMVQQGVELAKQGEGIRIAFERLGRGDILDGLRQATHGTVTDLELMKAAVKFNDFKLPVEELGTMLAFAQQKAKDTGQSVDYMVDSIVTGLGRKSLMILDNLGLSATEVKEKMKETGDMTKAVGAIIREQMSKAGDYVETAADRAAQANVSLQNKMEELGRKFAPIEEASNQLWTSMKIGILDVIDGPLMSLLNYLNQASKSAEDLLTESLSEVGSNVDDKGNYIKRPAQKGAAGFDWEKGTWKPGYSGAVYNAATGQTELPEVSITGTRREIPKKKPTKSVTKTPKTEEQLNNEEIQKLTQEYIHASEQRQAAIRDEIKVLQGRNELIQALKDQAQGKGFDPTKIQELTDLRGKQLTLTVTADVKDALEKVKAIEGVTIDDKAFTVTVTADDEKAAEKLRNLGAVEIGDKTFSVKANVGDTLEKVKAIEGVTIDDKTFDVTAETAEALRKLREIDGFKISPKTIEVTQESRPDFSSDMKRGKDMKWHDATTPVAPSEIKFSDGLQKQLNYMQKKESEKKEVNLASEMSKIASGVSGIFSGIESLGVELPQGLKDVMGGIQGMISILTSISTIVTAIQAISAADTLIPFARGGVVRAAVGYEVPGNHFSGDMVPALLNSGETVLNRAQSGILAAQLEGAGGSGGGTVRTVLSGEQCYLMIDRYARRTGKGEMVFWR